MFDPNRCRTVMEMCDGGFGVGIIDVSPLPTGDPNEYYVNRVMVPRKARGQGMGTRLMTRLAEVADREQMVLWIDPTANYGSNVERLTEFFRRFGFRVVDNRDKGYMKRVPIGAENSSASEMIGIP